MTDLKRVAVEVVREARKEPVIGVEVLVIHSEQRDWRSDRPSPTRSEAGTSTVRVFLDGGRSAEVAREGLEPAVGVAAFHEAAALAAAAPPAPHKVGLVAALHEHHARFREKPRRARHARLKLQRHAATAVLQAPHAVLGLRHRGVRVARRRAVARRQPRGALHATDGLLTTTSLAAARHTSTLRHRGGFRLRLPVARPARPRPSARPAWGTEGDTGT